MDKPVFRLILDSSSDAYTNMGTDEALLESGAPTLRLYEWNPPAVSIGYFQSLTQEVDLDSCSRQHIDLVRRITGGGAVFHHKELTYSFTCPETMVPKDIIASYELICGAVAASLVSLGLPAIFRPINDIVVNGKKISGSAQTRRQGVVLQHGTILIGLDAPLMFSLLKIPSEKMRDKLIAKTGSLVTSLNQEGPSVTTHMLRQAIVESFQKVIGISLITGALRIEEQNRAEVLAAKFRSDAWLRQRP